MFKLNSKNLTILKFLAPLFLVAGFFAFVPKAMAVYPVAGRKKFPLNKFFLTLFIFFTGFLIASPAYGATRTWNGNTSTDWNTAANWTNGEGGNSVPTSADDVVFADGAGTYALTAATDNISAKTFNTTGTASAVTVTGSGNGSRTFRAYGDITLKAGDNIVIVYITTYAPLTFSQNGAGTGGVLAFSFQGYGGNITLGSDLNTSGNVWLNSTSNFTTNNYTVTCGSFFDSGGTSAHALTLGTSVINTVSVSFTSSNTTVSGTTHTINISSDSATANNFAGKAWGIVNFKSNASAARAHAITPGSGASFVQFNIDQLTDRRDVSVSFDGDFSISQSSTWKSGGAGNDDPTMRMLIKSNTTGTQRTATVSAGSQTLTFTDVDFQDIKVATTNSPTITKTRTGDAGGNTGGMAITSAPKTVYVACGATASSQWSGNIWSSADDGTPDSLVFYPLPQDTAIITNNSFSSIGQWLWLDDIPRLGNVDMSGYTRSGSNTQIASHYTTVPLYFYGSLNFSSDKIAVNLYANAKVFDAKVASTLTVNSMYSLSGVTISSYGGTVQFASAITHTGTFTLTKGTLDLNGNTLTTAGFSSTGTVARTLQATGGGNVIITGVTGTVLDMADPTSLTVSNAPAIQIGTGALTLTADTTLAMGSSAKTFGALTFKKHAGNFSYIVTGTGNTFGAVTQQTPDVTYQYNKVIWPASASSNNVASYNVTGDGTYKAYTQSSSGGSPAHLVDSSGTTTNVFANATIQDMHVSGASWSLAYGSTSTSGNEGWGTARTWRGTTDTDWNTAGNWAENAIPTSSDDVVFDDAASGYTIASSATIYMKSFTTTGTVNAVTLTNSALQTLIYGDLTLKSGDVIDLQRLMYSASGILSQNSATLNCGLWANGITLTLGSNLSIDSYIHLYGGTIFDTSVNSYSITCASFDDNGYASAKTLTLNNSTLNVSNVSFTGTAPTITSTTHTINITATADTTANFAGKSWGTVNVAMTGGKVFTIADTAGTLNFAAFATSWTSDNEASALKLSGNMAVTGVFTVAGASGTTAGKRPYIYSNTVGTPRTITPGSIAITGGVNFQDITAGGNTWGLRGIESGNLGGNSNITFAVGVNQYWHVDSGSWSDTTKWFLGTNGTGGAGRVPLAQDTAVFNADSFDNGSQSITGDIIRLGSVDFENADNAPTLSLIVSPVTVYGGLVFASGMTFTTYGREMVFAGRGVFDLKTNGVVFNVAFALTINAPNGTVRALSALTWAAGPTNGITVSVGTFDANDQNITTRNFSMTGGTVVMGDGSIWTLTFIGGNPWSVTGGTVICETSTIKFTSNLAAARSFIGGNKTYYNFWNATTGAYAVQFTGANVFNNFKIDAGRTVQFTAGTNTTVNSFTATGTAAAPITIGSITSASHTLTKAGGGTVTCEHCSIIYSTAYPANTWYATLSTNGGNNSAWTFSPTQIYRSVGPAKTGNLATGGSNAMSIAGSTATFASGLPTNVGVGDVIQYDSDNNTSIDSLAFISGRTSATVYTVKSVSGDTPTATSASDIEWSIFRAYISLANAEKGVENTGIDSGLRNFDDWTAGGDATTDDVGKDIATANQVWNIAAYADAADTARVAVSGWTTSASNYIRIYTPYLTSEVGVSQRHSGKWDDSKYRLEVTAWNGVLIVSDYFVRIEGLQVFSNSTNSNAVGIYFSGDGEYFCSYNIVKGEGISSVGIGVAGNSTSKIWNNIIYGIDDYSGIFYESTTGGTNYAYNNTVYNSAIGIRINAGSNADVILKNNLSYNNSTADYVGTFNSASTNNLSKDGTAPALNAYYRNKTVSFFDAINNDFHLKAGDVAAKNNGTSLYNDANLPFATDIDGLPRSSVSSPQGSAIWDIGADETYASTETNTPTADRFPDASLVGEWSFDGKDTTWTSATEGTTNDLSGNSNTGTMTNMSRSTSPAEGVSGQGFKFDGVDDVVNAGSATNLDDLSALTFSAWTKPNSYGQAGQGYFVSKKSNTSGYGWNFQDLITNSTVVFTASFDGGTSLSVTGAANTLPSSDFGKWTHWTLTWDGSANASGVHIYKNGTEISYAAGNTNGTGNRRTDASYNVGIGNYADGNRAFDGSLDEVRVYSRALSPTEISALYKSGAARMKLDTTPSAASSLSTGLVGHWPFNGTNTTWTSASAGTTADLSGGNNTGTLTGMSRTTSPVGGVIGQGLKFDGVDDYVSVSGPVVTNTNTVSLWFKVISYPSTYGTLFVKDSSNGLFVKNNNKISFYYSSADHLNTTAFNQNQWHHLVVTNNGGNATFYIDGIADGTCSGAPGYNSVTRFGWDSYISDMFNGSLDEVRIYNRALSTTEITQLYEMGTRKTTPKAK